MTEKACRILLVEDNPSDALLLERALKKCRSPFELKVAGTVAEGTRLLADENWDVVLSDLSLPDGRGIEVVGQLRSCAPDLPIIVLTGLASDEKALESLDIGAQDYLVKDHITPEMLERSIKYAAQRQKSAAMRRLLAQLQTQKRMLQKKNRRLARLYKTAHRFVDNVSHEFRTPLTVVNEYVSLLRDGVVGSVNEEQNRMLDVVADRAEDLNNMVDDMLDISRLEAGMLGLWRHPSRIADIISHIAPSMNRKATVKQVELQFDIAAEMPPVYCDDEKVGRVLINLIVNAIKFCGRPGLVQVWSRFDEKAREAIIGITDNGEGIQPENLSIIFRRFKQVGANPRGSTKGFGLGLNIAKELVHLNFGDIHVKSTVGRGSTFWFSIPVADPLEVMSRYVQRIGLRHQGPCAVSLVRASVDDRSDPSLADDVNTFLNTLLRRHDLVFRIGEQRWLMAVCCEQPELEQLFERTEEQRKLINRNRPAEPLPPIIMEGAGTWLVPDEAQQFLDAVTQSLSPEPVAAC